MFGLPRRYAIDERALEASYEQLTLEYHPDFFAGATPEEKQRAEQQAADINEGYRTLRSEPLRASYLLDLLANGTELDRDSLPQGFLQEIFLLQEQVDELDSDGDNPQHEALRADAAGRLNAAGETLRGLFEEAERSPEPALLQQIQSELNCRRYLQRLLDRLTEPA